MKRVLFVFVGLCLLTGFVFAGSPNVFTPRAGEWKLSGDRLYQSDDSTGAMVAHIIAPQKGETYWKYDFNVRYLSGIEDMMGGFGVHLFVNDPSTKNNTWGNGESVLLWLNYDAEPYLDETPKGLSAQVYHSKNSYIMDQVGSFDLNYWTQFIPSDLSGVTMTVSLLVNSKTGQAWITNPIDGLDYTFNLGKKNLSGDYVSLRTNSMALSFGR